MLLTHKRGVSIMVGYVLLIVAAIALSSIVFYWMRSYVPTEQAECPDGVSVFVSSLNCEIENSKAVVTLTIKNNGRFGIMGLIIRGSTSEAQQIPDKDLTQFIDGSLGDGSLIFSGEDNNFAPGEQVSYEITTDYANIFSLELIPMRIEIQNNKKDFVGCKKSTATEIVKCGGSSAETGAPCTCPEDLPDDYLLSFNFVDTSGMYGGFSKADVAVVSSIGSCLWTGIGTASGLHVSLSLNTDECRWEVDNPDPITRIDPYKTTGLAPGGLFDSGGTIEQPPNFGILSNISVTESAP